MTAEALHLLKYKFVRKEQLKLNGFVSSSAFEIFDVVKLTLPYQGTVVIIPVTVITHQLYSDKSMVHQGLNNYLKHLRSDQCLSDDNILKPPQNRAPIQLLLGIDSFYKIVTPGYIKIKSLVLLPTITGYVVTGICRIPTSPIVIETVLTLSTSIDLNHYLELDSIDMKSSASCL